MCAPTSDPFSNKQTVVSGLSCFTLIAVANQKDHHQLQQHHTPLIHDLLPFFLF